MSAREQVKAYVGQLQARLRSAVLTRGAAVVSLAALIATAILVLITNHYAFSYLSLIISRVTLVAILLVTLGISVALPLRNLDRRRAVQKMEASVPDFNERLLTLVERDGTADPFLELLASETMVVADGVEPARVAPSKVLHLWFSISAISVMLLASSVTIMPGAFGYGASLLWLGAHHGAPFYALRVAPGNLSVRRNSDQVITAIVTGMQTNQARLYAHYQSASGWEPVSMQPRSGASGFQFVFAAIPEDIEYYVRAGALESEHYKLKVVDLPAITAIRATYHYPAWTGLKSTMETGGDLRAIEGTEVDLDVTLNQPLREGVLVLDDDKLLRLTSSGANHYRTTIHMTSDGAYHIAASEGEERVRLSDDFFIEALKAQPAEIRITRPGQDYRASPIEEVTVAVSANDEFGLNKLDLHYSVNGGPENTIDLLKQRGVKEINASTTLFLEDYNLVPGDVISLYATAKNGHVESRTDIIFVQAEPFERDFYQSQQMGGAGSGAGKENQGEISRREKEIIAATWRQSWGESKLNQPAAEAAKFLSEVQGKLRDQAQSLAGRMERRALGEENGEFNDFQKDMANAGDAMGAAAEKLSRQKWNEAIPQEQKALEHLLRAEATFRRIEVAFGAQGGRGNASAGRDLQSLFDLELDTEKNQYETAQSANPENQRERDIDQALEKLDELARRQQDLADRRTSSAPPFEQRWQQEMLRREVEELQRQMEQMAQSGQSSSQAGRQGARGDNQGASRTGSSSGANAQSNRSVQQALEKLREAEEEMVRAASPAQTEADAHQATERLRQAMNLLNGMRQQQVSSALDSLARESERLAREEREQAGHLGQMSWGHSGKVSASTTGPSSPDRNKLADDRRQTADDLSSLRTQIENVGQGMAAAGKSAAANKLREAIGQLQQSNVENLLKQSAEAIRGAEFSRAARDEAAMARALQTLSQQMRQVQHAAQGENGDVASRVQNLKNDLERLARNLGERNMRGLAGQSTPDGVRREAGRGEAPFERPDKGSIGDAQSGRGGRADGMGRPVDGYHDSLGAGPPPQYGLGFDIGGYRRIQGAPVEPDTSPIPVEQLYREAMNELNWLRQAVRGQPASLTNIQELMRELERLDPKRFPGNPEMLEQIRTKLLSQMDKLELQLHPDTNGTQSGQVRSDSPLIAPRGYEESVADYFRRLSTKP
jgi:hypothetical protein